MARNYLSSEYSILPVENTGKYEDTNTLTKLSRPTSILKKYLCLIFVALTVLSFLVMTSFLRPLFRDSNSWNGNEDLFASSFPQTDVQQLQQDDSVYRCENAAIVILVRNREAGHLAWTLKEFEDQFNSRYHYPYVMLNDEPFTDAFKKTVEPWLSGQVTYGLIDKEEWSIPSWINTTLAEENMAAMVKDNVIHGGSVSYRHMCRYNSGFFFRHPLVQKFDFYWRIEPGVRFLCKLNYDVFRFMRENKKKYSFVVSFDEIPETIPTLWDSVKEYTASRFINSTWMGFFQNGKGEYNLCHFWSNFEIGDLRFFRSPQYLDFFNYLDQKGGFFYERWGDAPVHSLAAGLFLKKNEVHFFKDIGYFHPPYGYCPVGTTYAAENCYECEQHNFLNKQHNCTPDWVAYEPERNESTIPDFDVHY